MVTWRKSTRSSDSFNCIEVAELSAAVLVRDSKTPGGPLLVFGRGSWRALLAGLRAGELRGPVS